VNVVTLSVPTAVVVAVNPAPTVIVFVFGYRSITTPEPPAPPVVGTPFHDPPPPPPPVFAVPLPPKPSGFTEL